jgi:hypothetical protein
MPQNTRVFEQLDGLLTVTSLFKSRETGREVKFRLTEFLYFYLTPEEPSIPRAAADARAGAAAASGLMQRSPSKLAKVFGASGGEGAQRQEGEDGATLSVEEKKLFVDRYLPGVVDELLKDLDTYKPFGGVLS